MAKFRATGACVLGLAAAGLLATPAMAAEGNSHVSVLHGIPGATVDVYVNGDLTLEDFKPGTLTDPLALPKGSYDLKVTAPDAGADGDAVVEAKGVEVPAGKNLTVVAHLSGDAKPTLTPFVNDTSTVKPGEARVTVRHVAAAPAVDVRANGSVIFPNLTNPNEKSADVPAGKVSADVVLAGTDTVAIGPADLDLKEGTNTIVYAWGSAADKNLQLAVQSVSGIHSSPHGVPAGTGGNVATDDTGRWLLISSAAGLVAAAGLRLSARRKVAK